MKVSLRWGQRKALESIHMQISLSTKGIGQTMSQLGMVEFVILMEKNIVGNGLKIVWMVMVTQCIQMEIFMTDNL